MDYSIPSPRLWGACMDPHFSRAPSLDQRDSLLFGENLFLWKSWSRHLFYIILKGKIKQERKP